MAIATISQAILRGDISIYLAANDNANGALYGARKASASAVTIAMVTDALTWALEGGAQTDQELRAMANYLIWLIGIYGMEAEAIIDGGGGGSVISGGGIVRPAAYQFIVSDTSFIPTGGSGVIIDRFIGYELLFVRGVTVQSTEDLGGTFYSWDKPTGHLLLLPDPTSAAIEGELMQLWAVS